MKRLKNIIIISFLALSFNGVAQKDSKLLEVANQKYEEFSFIDARKDYLKLVNRGQASSLIYGRLGDTFYFNSDYANALTWYTKLFEQQGDILPEYYFRYSKCLKSAKKVNDAFVIMNLYQNKFPNKKTDKTIGMLEYQDYIRAQSGRADLISEDNINSPLSDFGLTLVPNSELYIQNLDRLKLEKQMRRSIEREAIRQRKIADGIIKNVNQSDESVSKKFKDILEGLPDKVSNN